MFFTTVTEELVRKKSEHNECVIGTLEELSLHQEDVEKIEYLHNWCKGLQILYLQSNLISKIGKLSIYLHCENCLCIFLSISFNAVTSLNCAVVQTLPYNKFDH